MDKQEREKKILESSSNFKVKGTLTKEEAWDRLESKIDFGYGKTRSMQIAAFKWAASISIILGITFLMLRTLGNEEYVSKAEIIDIELPDGSLVTMDENSSISFNKYLWNVNRNVHLNGHAYFDVEKGSTFKVLTNNGFVEVLGTEFNILEGKDRFDIFCFEGRVAVYSKNEDNKVYLTDGLATSLDNKNLTSPYRFNKEKIAAWKNGLFYFEKESLSKVFQDIEEYYNVDILLEAQIEKKNFSGVFKKGEIKTVMEIVCSSMGLEFVLEENVITVTN